MAPHWSRPKAHGDWTGSVLCEGWTWFLPASMGYKCPKPWVIFRWRLWWAEVYLPAGSLGPLSSLQQPCRGTCKPKIHERGQTLCPSSLGPFIDHPTWDNISFCCWIRTEVLLGGVGTGLAVGGGEVPGCWQYFCLAPFLCVCGLVRAAPSHMEIPRVGVLIRASGAGLHHSHSNARSEPHLRLHHSWRSCWILNPLSKARNGTRNLVVPGWIRFRFAMMGTPSLLVLMWVHSFGKIHQPLSYDMCICLCMF